MDSVPDALDRLCAQCGVEAEYHDIWGQRRRPSDAIRLQLLRAMGVAVESAADAASALALIEERDWARTLPPVKVVREGAPASRLVLTLPTDRAQDSYNWLLKLESGERAAG